MENKSVSLWKDVKNTCKISDNIDLSECVWVCLSAWIPRWEKREIGTNRVEIQREGRAHKWVGVSCRHLEQ